MKLSRNFTLDELLESETATRMNYTEQFNPPDNVIQNLQALCETVLQPLRDFIRKPIIITSGYRCERLNKRVKGARNSQHLYGQAVDFKVHDISTEELTKVIITLDLPFDQVIEEFGRWVHVSHTSTPFNRKQAGRAVRINGRTRYLQFDK